MKFYDTNALLKLKSKAFCENFAISTVTLRELENIKTSAKKDESIKYDARQTVHILDENYGKYIVIIDTNDITKIVESHNVPVTPDNIIIASALALKEQDCDVEFVSDDVAARVIATHIFGLEASRTYIEPDDHIDGYVEAYMSEDEMSEFYSNMTVNKYGVLVNEYIVIKNAITKETVEVRKWNGTEFVDLYKRTIRSVQFDKVKPKDDYQKMVVDSIMTNDATIITGKPGSGKSLLALACIMNLLESGKFDRAIVVFNPQPVKGSGQIGFLPGSKNEKAMDSGIGNILTSKFGDKFIVENMLSADKLRLIPMSEIRGMEVKAGEIMYITECQNASVEMMRLCFQRNADGAKMIFEGDFDAQVDNQLFEGERNGLRRAINVCKGDNSFGHIDLKNIWRSHIASLADNM